MYLPNILQSVKDLLECLFSHDMVHFIIPCNLEIIARMDEGFLSAMSDPGEGLRMEGWQPNRNV